ncbi:hypothetical protein AKO1_008222 [Acrasis kona]|uniref:Protein kinase domain-containing protein n=1 Tax=Acrasis kona TaxID=1008807 RepID=A0AAW2YQR8_9EUKA
MWYCNNTLFNSSSVCSGVGSCRFPDICICPSNYKSDKGVCHPICFGADDSKEKVCSGNGKCIAPNQCVCNEGWVGESCRQWSCYGIYANDSSVCNNRGRCVQHNVCECFNYSLGNNCYFPGWAVITAPLLTASLFLFVFICIPITCTACKHYKKVRKQNKAEADMKYLLLNEKLRIAESNLEIVDSGWLIKMDDLKFVDRISEGNFGIVFKGEYRCSPVAIKKIKDDTRFSSVEFEHEISVLKSLHHPNVVLFLGVCVHDDYKFIVTEYMDGQSLEHVVISNKRSSKRLHQILSLDKKINILSDVTRGMIYLHSLDPPLCHRDLKPSNILLDKNMYTAKVADFGSSRRANLNNNNMTGYVGTLTYMSPEVIMSEQYDTSCDVYSFGIVMYELFFETKAYSTFEMEQNEFMNMFHIGIGVTKGNRPVIPNHNYSERELKYLTLMKQCWGGDVNSRPCFSNIIQEITMI